MNRVEQIAYEKGYRVHENGYVISHINNILKPIKNNKGYYIFCFRDSNNKNKNCLIHRLMAYQKFGEKMYEDGIEVRHKNNNKDDNTFENILIGNHQENMLDLPKDDRQKYAEYATSFIRKYDKREVQVYYSNCRSYKQTMEQFEISSKGTLYYILNN